MKRRVVLLGPPGSGKGTVAERLQAETGITHISSGELLRREVESGSGLGKQVQAFLENGELVPDELMLAFMEAKLELVLRDSGFLLDGFPRTVAQAESLDRWLYSVNGWLESVLFYDCSIPVIVERITGRRVCPACGRSYHLTNKPPRNAGVCDACGAGLIQRDDDTEGVLRKRLAVYSKRTEPLVDYYNRQRKLTVLNAALPSEAIYLASLEALTE